MGLLSKWVPSVGLWRLWSRFGLSVSSPNVPFLGPRVAVLDTTVEPFRSGPTEKPGPLVHWGTATGRQLFRDQALMEGKI